MEFDHVALATDDVAGALGVLVGELGGRVIGGGTPGPFRAMQVRLGSAADGMNVELLEPWDLAQGDFLRRFLDRHGEGPHHLTFKTDDISAELDRQRNLGFDPVGVQVESDFWREFFLHPEDGHGTVIQIAQLMIEEAPMAERMTSPSLWSERWWPQVEPAATAVGLEQVVIGSSDVAATEAFFVDVLGGTAAKSATVSWGRDRIRVVPSDEIGVLGLELSHAVAPPAVAGCPLTEV